ncbi:MAG: lipopolysaccharide kinase InaA family protein [Pseudomonadota bacterium]
MSRKILNEGGWANGTVFLEDSPEGPVVVKSYARRIGLIRMLGRYLLSRERRAYRRLEGITGVPELVPDPDPLRLSLRFIESERISNERLAVDGAVVIKHLRRVVADMHARGVYHLDLRNQGNVLVDAEGRCYLIDFASSLYLPPSSLRRLVLTPLARAFDRYGLGKWEARAGQQLKES